MRTVRTGLLLSLVLALLGLTVPAAQAVGGTVTGHITNTDGVPQNGTALLCKVNPTPPRGDFGCGGNNIVNGDFSVSEDLDGTYLVRIISSTMNGTNRYYLAGDPAGTLDRDIATLVTFPADDGLVVNMELTAIAKVEGNVVNSDGDPMPNLGLAINQNGQGSSFTTDATGHFDLGYIRAGSWPLATAHTLEFASATTTMNVPASGTLTLPTLVMKRFSAVSGTVTDASTGAPLPYVYVEAYRRVGDSYLGSAYTDSTGHYRVGGLSTDPFWIRYTDPYSGYVTEYFNGADSIATATDVTLLESEERTLNVALAPLLPDPLPAHNLSGVVTDDLADPLPGIMVTTDASFDITDRWGRWSATVPDGTYHPYFQMDSALTNDLPGLPWFPEYYGDAGALADATPLTVSGGVPRDDVDASLVQAGMLTGTVHAPDGVTGANPTDLWVYDSPTQLNQRTFTDATSLGTWSALVRPGTVRVLIGGQLGSTKLLPQWHGGTSSFATGAPVTVASGQTVSGVDVTLGTALTPTTAPTISGTPKVGRTLRATTGQWNLMTHTTWAVTWLRGTKAVGSGTSYVVKPADAGARLRARVTATNGGFVTPALTAPRRVAKLATKTSLTPTSPKAGVVRLVVKVSANGLRTLTGKITIKRGTKVVKRGVKLVKGRAVVLLSGQPSGSHAYTAAYGGSKKTLASHSRLITVKVL